MQYVESFREFYYLEEGIISDGVVKALKSVTSKDQIKQLVKHFKIDKQKLIKLLSYVKKFSSYLYDNVFEHLRTPERIGFTAIGERKAPALAVILAWLIIEVIMVPLSVGLVVGAGKLAGSPTPKEAQIEQLKAEVDEIVAPVLSNAPVNTATKKHSNTPAIKSTSKWSRYTSPDLFITVVKAFEAGDYKQPTKSTKPLQSYHDRTQQSIGYGTKANAGETVLSQKEAIKRLVGELSYNRQRVREMLKQKGWQLNNIQINGLTDFAFNRGDNALRQMVVKAKNLEDLSKDILATTFITTSEGSKVHSKAIADRREWEVALLSSK